MPFRNQLVVRENPADNEEFILAEDLVYEGNQDTFVIPAGFITDFASVPRILWNLFPPYGKYTKAAVVHDYHYINQGISREDADGIFRRMMRELGVGYVRRYLMWAAVRIGGRYRKNVDKQAHGID